MRTRNCFLSAIAGFGVAMAAAQNGQAAVLLSDNFDADSPTSVLNFDGFINWTVDSGTVDYIRSGDFGIVCVGGTGGCVDSDGSSNQAGRLLSRATFDLPAGTSYTLTLEVSGNQQRLLTPDVLELGTVEAAGVGIFASTICVRAGTDPFSTCTITAESGGSEFRVFIRGLGSDNVGAVFDNFALTTAEIAQVPEPATLALFGIGLAGLGFGRRRKHAAT
jgi:hypothetical protein